MRVWLAIAFVVVVTQSSSADSREIGPTADWCAQANSLEPGDELALRPGSYPGPCVLRRGGSPGRPVVIRASDAANPPHVVYHGSAANVVTVSASFITLRALAFGPTLPDVDAVRIRRGSDITIEDSTFADLGGIAVASTSTTSERLFVRRNEILRSKATAIYVGCHDGVMCRITDAVVEDNYIHGVDPPAPSIGYGIQVKLNSMAVIRDNVVVETKGPGIMAYGAHDPGAATIIERNFVAYSQRSSGIVIGGGPVIVRNNIAVGGAEAGISVIDYGRRGLVRGIVLSHNTIYGARTAGIAVPAAGTVDVRIAYNAVHSVRGADLPRAAAGVLAIGNVDCAVARCFLDPISLDFGPLPGSPLPARTTAGVDAPREDFFGTLRPYAAAAGAVELSRGGLQLGRKSTTR